MVWLLGWENMITEAPLCLVAHLVALLSLWLSTHGQSSAFQHVILLSYFLLCLGFWRVTDGFAEEMTLLPWWETFNPLFPFPLSLPSPPFPSPTVTVLLRLAPLPSVRTWGSYGSRSCQFHGGFNTPYPGLIDWLIDSFILSVCLSPPPPPSPLLLSLSLFFFLSLLLCVCVLWWRCSRV